MICSRCEKTFNKGDLFYEIGQYITINYLTEEGVINQIQNLSEPTHEFLCEECFNSYVDKMNELMHDYDIKKLVNLVEVIDDVQFG